MRAPLPSKAGPCPNFMIGSGTKFCTTCGHTGGKHRFTARNIPLMGGWFVVLPQPEGDVVQPSDPMTEADAKLKARRMNKEAMQ